MMELTGADFYRLSANGFFDSTFTECRVFCHERELSFEFLNRSSGGRHMFLAFVFIYIQIRFFHFDNPRPFRGNASGRVRTGGRSVAAVENCRR